MQIPKVDKFNLYVSGFLFYQVVIFRHFFHSPLDSLLFCAEPFGASFFIPNKARFPLFITFSVTYP